MNDSNDTIMNLIKEVNALSENIANMKRKANLMEPGSDRDQLRQDIKMKQYQALFYIEKMGNLERERKHPNKTKRSDC